MNSLQVRIIKAREARDRAEGRYQRLMAMCSHHFVETRHESAQCDICSKDGGWYCPDSEDHLCSYEASDECCIHCHAPEERK